MGKSKNVLVHRGRAIRLQEKTDFTLDQVKGNIKLMKDVVIKPFKAVRVPGLTKIRNHQKWVHIMESSEMGSHNGRA